MKQEPNESGIQEARKEPSNGWTQVSRNALIGIVIGCAILGLLLGAIPGFLFSRYLSPSRPSFPSVEVSSPHYVAADTAIARFGIAPVNPDWLQVTHKLTGEQLQAVPSHEWAVFTFAFEPKIEKIEQPNGVALWKVTFEP